PIGTRCRTTSSGGSPTESSMKSEGSTASSTTFRASRRRRSSGNDAMKRALLAFGLAVPLTACGHAPIVETVSMRMQGGPPNATVTIDERIVGSLDVIAARGVALPPGRHRVSVEAPGYFPWDQ